jgi:predicted porin
MKFKTTAIALAVAGIVAAPVAVQAGADEIYASARIGGIYSKSDEDQLEIKSMASRFGAKGETDLGNGMTGFGRYEWNVDFQNGDDDVKDAAGDVTDSGKNSTFSLRHRYVGLKGDFGSVLLGQTNHTFYNFTVGAVDIPWWFAGGTMVNYRGRTDHAITYAGGSGDFSFGSTLYAYDDDDEENIDAHELGGSMAIGDMTLGAAYQGSANDDQGSDGSDKAIFSVTLSGIAIGDTNLGVNVQAQEDDTGIVGNLDIGNAYIHIEYLLVDKDSGASVSGDDEDKVDVTLGYNQSLGRKTQMWYELNYKDADTDDDDDDRTAIMAVLKYDII